MKDYIRDYMKKKVADKLAVAEKAKRDQFEKDSKAVKAVKEYAESLIPEATKKVVAFAKEQGLTWFEYKPAWNCLSSKPVNVAFSATVDSYDFEETNQQDNNMSAARNMRKELEEEPKRINKAVDKATNAIVFSLELGKVKKAELEELIESTEVEI
jgi:hypothetical protein